MIVGQTDRLHGALLVDEAVSVAVAYKNGPTLVYGLGKEGEGRRGGAAGALVVAVRRRGWCRRQRQGTAQSLHQRVAGSYSRSGEGVERGVGFEFGKPQGACQRHVDVTGHERLPTVVHLDEELRQGVSASQVDQLYKGAHLFDGQPQHGGQLLQGNGLTGLPGVGGRQVVDEAHEGGRVVDGHRQRRPTFLSRHGRSPPF